MGAFDDILKPDWAPPAPATPEVAPAPQNLPAVPEGSLYSEILDPNWRPVGTEADDTDWWQAGSHAAGRGALPAAAGIAAFAPGFSAGAAVGAFGGPAAPITVPVFGLIGGTLTSLAAAFTTATVQDYALDQMPEDWKEPLGQSDRQRRLDQTYEPTASFIGGLIPYALTMKPGGFGKVALPANATAWQRVAASPVTSRIFAGGLNGGMELGMQAAEGEVRWNEVAIATAFGTVFNQNNRLGERLMRLGNRPVRGLAEAVERRTGVRIGTFGEPEIPTVAQAGDAKVMGPGITEEVFMGSHTQAPEAEMAAQNLARQEAEVLRPTAASAPDVRAAARSAEPDLFADYDALVAQKSDLRATYDTIRNLEAPSPQEAALLRQIGEVDKQIDALSGDVGAAMRRAADQAGGEVIEPEVPVPEITTETLTDASRETITAQTVAIAQEIERQMVAAGRPADEARFIGQVEAAYSTARAARFGGDITPFGVFERSGAEIRGYPRKPPLMPTLDKPEIVGPGIEAQPNQVVAAETTPQNITENITGARTSERPPGEGSLFDEDVGKQTELFQPAYHGTPHIFDKFDSSKIGTGEGAQAFGYGLYFAGRKEVGDYYRNTLVGDHVMSAQRALKRAGGNVDEAMREADAEIARLKALDLTPESGAATRDDKVAAQESNLRELATFKETGNWRKGRLLTVDIPGDDELLAWDAPLSEQPPKVKAALKTLGITEDAAPARIADRDLRYIVEAAIKANDGDASRDSVSLIVDNDGDLYKRALAYAKKNGKSADDLEDQNGVGAYIENEARDYLAALHKRYERKGESIYREIQNKVGGDPAAASAALKDAGIPGHRFLDQASRTEGEGTHNYVIYDDSRVNVTAYEQKRRGSITLQPGRKPLIKLFADADASTIIHENGHKWLEDLLTDAQTAGVKDWVKADDTTVRNWLGMKPDQGAPTTRQHEKFADAAIQYFREGVAPSKELAGVFAKFKDWLVSLYRTIKGLGTPINEDIRAVFDRMLSTDPRRTVIAPEQEAAGSLPGLHETDALDVHPAEADPVGDRINAEAETYITSQPPEIQDELRAAIAAIVGPEAGAGDAGGTGVGPGGAEPQSFATGRSGSGERPPVQAGGAAGMGEGGGGAADTGLRSDRPGVAEAARANPLSSRPSDLFGPDQSPFLDKAGNIRVENLTSDADVGRAIHDAADANDDFIGDRRGKITDGQRNDLADALGMDAESLSERKVGEAFNAEQVWAARKLLIESATNVAALMKKAADGTDADVMAYAQAKARHNMIQGHIAGITAEAGRALRAFRGMAGQEAALGIDQIVKNSTAKTLFQLRAEAKLGAQLDTPQKVSKFMLDSHKPTFGDMILEYWINGLVSGPKTHMMNMVGNTMLSVMKVGPDTLAAAMIGSVRKAMGREGSTVRLGEIGAQIEGGLKALPASIKASVDALRIGKSTALPAEEMRELPLQPGSELAQAAELQPGLTYAQLGEQLYATARGTLDAIVATGKLVSAGGDARAPGIGLRRSPLGAIPDIQVRGVTVAPLGTLARLPTRMLAAEDSFFRAMNYSMELNALAYRQAMEEGLRGQQFDARVATLRAEPSAAMMEEARAVAAHLTLTERRSAFVKALNHLASTKLVGLPIVKFITPFINTPANIIEQAVLRRTPIGLFSPELRADLMGANGTIAQDTAMGRMLVGSAISLGFGFLAAQGLVSGSGPSDPGDAALWRMAGNQAHSVRIGDTWYQINQLGPIGMMASIAADMYDVAHSASEGDYLKAGSMVLQGFTQNILDASFMSGPANLIEALQDPGRYGEQYIKGFLSGFLPYSGALGQVTRTTDPYMRQAGDIVASLKAKTPGLSQTLLPRRDIWGQPMPQRQAIGSQLGSGVYISEISTDPVVIAMSQIGYWPGQVDRKIRGVELTDEQFDQFAAIAGVMAKQRLDVIVNSPDWRRWPPQVKSDVLREAFRQSREIARGMMMGRFPDIAVQATRLKLEGLQP